LIFLAFLLLAGCAGAKSMPEKKSSPGNNAPQPVKTQRVAPSGTAETRLKDAAQKAGVAWPLQSTRLKVFKKARRLELWAEDKLVQSYTVALGADPELDKFRQGDHRTPEGEFYVCTRNDLSKFHLFLGLSYPNEEDAERGLREKLITKSEYQQILSANRTKSRPPWNTGLGGEVGIHGGGTGQDWTWGCVALENADIEELWIACAMKTPVTIQL
jgi:L,D-peptidoglycan transpeptidase YkuD (ErfK/YbiS/YcfS/YnhG family)